MYLLKIAVIVLNSFDVLAISTCFCTSVVIIIIIIIADIIIGISLVSRDCLRFHTLSSTTAVITAATAITLFGYGFPSTILISLHAPQFGHLFSPALLIAST